MLSEATEDPSIDPQTLIKRLCGKKASAVVLLHDDSRRGEVHLHGGRVVRALCGALDGEEALFGMLMWPNPKTWIAPLFERPEINILSDLDFLTGEQEPDSDAGS